MSSPQAIQASAPALADVIDIQRTRSLAVVSKPTTEQAAVKEKAAEVRSVSAPAITSLAATNGKPQAVIEFQAKLLNTALDAIRNKFKNEIDDVNKKLSGRIVSFKIGNVDRSIISPQITLRLDVLRNQLINKNLPTIKNWLEKSSSDPAALAIKHTQNALIKYIKENPRFLLTYKLDLVESDTETAAEDFKIEKSDSVLSAACAVGTLLISKLEINQKVAFFNKTAWWLV